MNRRQLAKGLTAGVAAASLGGLPLAASAPVSKEDRSFSAAWKQIAPGIWKVVLGTPEPHTPVNLRLVPPVTEQLRAMPTVAAPPLPEVTGTNSNRGFLLSLPLAGGEEIYGFGLQLLSFQHRSQKRTLRVNADPKVDSGDSHAPVPFFVTTRGYGVLVDTLREASFYCGDAHQKPTRAVSLNSAELHTPEQSKQEEEQSPGNILVEVPRAYGVAVYLFAGPSMLNAVQRYILFSGGGVVPPEWGLGFWYRAELQSDHESALALAREFRERKIPCDVLGLEPGWQTHAYSCTFAWNPQRFPNPQQFIADARALDLHVNIWEHAFTHPSSPIFEPLLPHAGDYAVWGGLVPDFAGEPARNLFGEYHGRHFIDAGVSGFKLDECDNSDFTGGWSFPAMSRFPSGLDGEQMHAIFGLRYQDTLWKQFQQRNQPTYSLARSSGALAAPYPFVLYSDLYDHRQFIRGLVNSGFSGLLWCPEVRDASSEEDLIRRLQSVVFSPLAMVNAWYIKNPPWKQLDRERNNRGELDPNWQALESRCREVIGWRMQLIPYLQAAFHRYAADGTPPFRALVLDNPNEMSLRGVDDQFMVGDRMMVAPLFAGEASREVVLPPGEWFDLWTRKRIAGGRTVKIPGSAPNIPVFIKDGSVLPLAAIGPSSAGPESRELTLHVFGDGRSPFELTGEGGHVFNFSWDPAKHTGHMEAPTTAPRPYRVVSWEQHPG